MKIGKLKPTATIVAQFPANVEIEAISHEGKMFLPIVGMGEFATSSAEPSAPAKPTSPITPPSSGKGDENPTKKYTEKELMAMETKDLLKLCKDTFGINPDDYDGKNTNKKLRDLILEAQESDEKPDEEPDDEEEKPTKKGGKKSSKDADDEDDDEDDGDDDTLEKVQSLLDDFDSGKRNKKKTIAEIMKLGDADEDEISEAISNFEDDADADAEAVAKDIVSLLEDKKPKSKKDAKKGKKSEKLVDPEDLEVGQRVSVWWDDDNQEWYDGEVVSIKKGKIKIAYDDDTEEFIDPEVHTKIKLID